MSFFCFPGWRDDKNKGNTMLEQKPGQNPVLLGCVLAGGGGTKKADQQKGQTAYSYARDRGREEVGEESLCMLLSGRS